jgi:NADPH:quinone reductase-like Zn-dependent oxidoreductase
MLIQAHLLPAQVVAVVNGKDKVDFLKDMGVDHVFDASQYSAASQPLHQAIKAVVKKGDACSLA